MIEGRIGDPLAEVETLRDEALASIASAADMRALEEARIRYTGKKSTLSQLSSVMAKLTPEDRKVLGQALNSAKGKIELALEARAEQLSALELVRRLEAERLDVTLPGTPFPRGYEHPLLKTVREILAIFAQMGYSVYEGTEVEWDRYNFELLNIPKDHPARDMQDTFYLTEDVLLRTQTSPAQIHVMHANEPPIRAVVPGFVYRNEAEDASHGDQFFQIEGLCVDEDITLGDLKGTLTEVAHRYFGPDRRIRFRPSYFPFTEPSAEMDIECAICHGAGCRSCGYEGWLELGGSGMVHPQVLRNGGYDPDRVSGFAFGIGPDRYTMQKYGINDLRLFREDDLRFLRQFG